MLHTEPHTARAAADPETIMIATLNNRRIAVCISQPSLRLVLPSGEIWEAVSTPLLLSTSSSPAPTVLGFDGQRPPSYTGLTRPLTADELAADAILVPLVEAYVPLLRAAGYRGQIITPGVVRPHPGPGDRPAAHHSTVTVLADADPLLGYIDAEPISRHHQLAAPGHKDSRGKTCECGRELESSQALAVHQIKPWLTDAEIASWDGNPHR
jgi:hypothetical protein